MSQLLKLNLKKKKKKLGIPGKGLYHCLGIFLFSDTQLWAQWTTVLPLVFQVNELVFKGRKINRIQQNLQAPVRWRRWGGGLFRSLEIKTSENWEWNYLKEVTTEHVPEGMLFKGQKGGKSALFLFSVCLWSSQRVLNFWISVSLARLRVLQGGSYFQRPCCAGCCDLNSSCEQ